MKKRRLRSSFSYLNVMRLSCLCLLLALLMGSSSVWASETGTASGSAQDISSQNPDGSPQDQTGSTTNPEGSEAGQNGTGTAPGNSGQNGTGTAPGNSGQTDPSAAQQLIIDANGMITGFNPAWLSALPSDQTASVSLTIPASVNGITVKGIAAKAFDMSSYQTDYPRLTITKLTLPVSASFTTIGNDAFSGCSSLTGTLKLPDSLTSIGSKAFSGTGYSAIYLPASASVTYGPGAFSGSKLSMLICPGRAVYDSMTADKAGPQNALTYPLTLTFLSDGSAIDSRPALYNQPLYMIQQSDGFWTRDNAYKLPAVPNAAEGQTAYWAFPSAPDTEVTVKSAVTDNTLNAVSVSAVALPSVSFGDNIKETYTGDAFRLQVNASHPQYKPKDEAAAGDMTFYYTWELLQNNTTQTQKGYDLNTLSFTDTGSYTVNVTVQAIIKGEDSPFSEHTHTFTVQILQAEPEVKPQLPEGTFYKGDKLPELTLPDASVPGTLAWKNDEVLREGTHSYEWTFTPEDQKNYKSVSGTTEIQAEARPQAACSLTVSANEHGTVSPSGKFTLTGEEAKPFTITPDTGCRIDRVMLDGEDVTDDLRDLEYILYHEAADCTGSHELTVSFRMMTAEETVNMFKTLPSLTEGQISTEHVNAYLDAKITYEMLREHIGVPEDTLLNYYRSLAKLPCIHTEMDANLPVILTEPAWLLDSITQEQAAALRNNRIQRLNIVVEADAVPLTARQQEEILDLKPGAKLLTSYEVTLAIRPEPYSRYSQPHELTSFNRPLKLRFTLRGDLKGPESGYSRSYFVAGFHGNGKKQSLSILNASFSEDKDKNRYLTAESSQFSVFSLIYVDTKENKPEQKPEEKPNDNQGGGSSGDSSGGSSGGSSSTYVPDYEKEFWDSVTALIRKAKAGDTVNVNAVTYDKMPEGVMAALRENSGVALIVRWDGGDAVMIPARTALTKDSGRVYYPLSYLSTYYKTLNAALTQPVPTPAPSGGSSGSGSSSGSGTSAGNGTSAGSSTSGSTWEVSAPTDNDGSYTPTPEDMGVDESQPETESETAETESTDESLTAEQTGEDLELKEVSEKSESKLTAIVLVVSIALLALVVLVFVVLLTLKKKN